VGSVLSIKWVPFRLLKTSVHLNAFTRRETTIQVKQALHALQTATPSQEQFCLIAYATACGREVAANDVEHNRGFYAQAGVLDDGYFLAVNTLAFRLVETSDVDSFIEYYVHYFAVGYESFVKNEAVILFPGQELRILQLLYEKLSAEGLPESSELAMWQEASKGRGIHLQDWWVYQ